MSPQQRVGLPCKGRLVAVSWMFTKAGLYPAESWVLHTSESLVCFLCIPAELICSEPLLVVTKESLDFPPSKVLQL